MQSSSYRPDIDGLRAVAVLMVVLFHFRLVPYADAGFLGVDVFFVISGFLITSIIINGAREGSFRLLTFYGKRVRRLAPALIATMVMTLAFGAAWLFPVDFKELAYQALVTQFYGSNFYFWFNVNYFGLSADTVYLLHTWSLAVEEQFYLVYPIVLLLIHRFYPRLLWPLIWAGGIASFFLNLWLVSSKPEATFYLLPTRAWELLAGAVCWQLVEKRIRLRTEWMEAVGLIGIGSLLISIFFFQKDFSIPGSYAGLAVIGAAAVIYSGSFGPTWVSKALGQRVCVYIGRISYPLYLVHWPIDVFARSYFNEFYDTSMRTGMLALSFGLASLIYHLIENPIRTARFDTGSNRLLTAYFASLAATVGVFVISQATNGLPQRFPDDVLEMAAYSEDHTESSDECRYEVRKAIADSLCTIGAADIDPTWMIYGDSHAWAARSAFNEWLRRRGESGYFVFRSSCLPIAGTYLVGEQGVCFRFNEEVNRFVLASDQIENVLLVSTWRQVTGSRLSTSPVALITPEESLALFDRKFAENVSRYADAGKRVHIWEPLPWATMNVPRAIARAMLRGSEDPEERLRVTIGEYRSAFRFFFEAVEKNRGPIYRTYSPSSFLCDEGSCRVMLDGVPVFFDSTHLTRSTFKVWADMLEAADRVDP